MDKKVYDYVKKHFINYFPEICTMMEKDEINNIVVEVCKELKVYDRSIILESRVDEMIFDLLNGFCKKNRTKLWNDAINLENYISKFVIDNDFSNCSEGITDYIVKKITSELIPHYTLSKLNKGFFDGNIKVIFDEYKNKIFNNIYSLIYKFINNIDVMVPWLKNDAVARDLALYFMKNGSYKIIEELEKGKHDDFIKKYVNKISNSLEQKRTQTIENKKINSTEYICSYIIENLDVDRKLSDDELIEYSAYINSRLSVPNKNRDRGLSPEEIVSSMFDSEIVRYYNRYMMKQNSTDKKNVSKKIKPMKKRRFLHKNISILLVTASLLGVFGTGAVVISKGMEAVKDKVDTIVTTFRFDDTLNEFDNYDYSYIFYSGNDAVKPTAKNAIDFHVKVRDGQYGNDNYNYLGFYRAYQSVREDRLYVMDTMLSIVKLESSKQNVDSGFYKAVNDATCYLEFAMDRLKDMGCEEIKDSKYHDALFKYLEVKNKHRGEEPLQYMDKNDKEIIEDVMEKYRKYSDKLMNDFMETIQEEKSELKTLSVNSRRGI